MISLFLGEVLIDWNRNPSDSRIYMVRDGNLVFYVGNFFDTCKSPQVRLHHAHTPIRTMFNSSTFICGFRVQAPSGSCMPDL